MQAYEGYLEKGQVYPMLPLTSIKGRRRVIITVLDESTREKADTWADLDKIVASMSEKPRLEDFPRCSLGRELVDFDEVQ
jgi:hypothetical protein